MVFILHRYIFRELIKVFALSSVGLTVIFSLGSMLRPIQEFGVGPAQVMSLLGYTIPIMLTFVLPVAALFATSLVYGRFASDNEFDACRASGVSPTMLLYPGLILAIAVSIANLVLSFHVVPTYVHRAEVSMKADAKQILFRNIQRQGYYTLPKSDMRIYADAVDIENSRLIGVVIIDADSGKQKRLTTAESANIEFKTNKLSSEVKVIAQNAFQFDQHGGMFSGVISAIGQIPSMMPESVKFQKIDQINAIKQSPINYYPIAKTAWSAYERLAIEMLKEDIEKALSAAADNYYQLSNGKQILKIRADKCDFSENNIYEIKLAGNAAVFDYDQASGKLMRSYRGEQIALSILEDPEERPCSKLLLTLPNAIWLERGNEYVKPRFTANNLNIPVSVTAKLGENVIDTVKNHPYLPNPTGSFASLAKELDRKTGVTMREIKAEIHSRLTFGIGCIALIIIGITLGIKIKGGHALTAFGVSSAPAAALLIFIMTGKNIAKNQASAAGADTGVMFMWAGLIILSMIALILYRKLLKN